MDKSKIRISSSSVRKYLVIFTVLAFTFGLGAFVARAIYEMDTTEPVSEKVAPVYPSLTTTTAPEPTTTTEALPELEPVDADAIANGIFVVGKTIQPGTYVSDGPAGKAGCYWALLKATDGKIESIIVNQHIMSGKVTVEVPKDAVAFQTSNCKSWKLVEVR